MRVYLDTNVYFRPYDDHSQFRIREEALAFISILARGRGEEYILLSSDILSLEVRRTKDLLKRSEVEQNLALCKKHIELSKDVKRLPRELEKKCLVDGRDALHIAFGCYGGADYFLTCDDNLINKKDQIEKIVDISGHRIKVINPINFLKILEERGNL